MLDYSLRLFDILLKRDSVGIPSAAKALATEEYISLKSREDITQKDVDVAMIKFGKEAWAYWQAEESFVEKYGREKEKELFLSCLSIEGKAKWKMYEEQLGEQQVYDHDDKFEESFTPEDNIELERAVVEAKVKVLHYIRSLASIEKVDEYLEVAKSFIEEQENITSLLVELAGLKDFLPDISEEIDQVILYVEYGFAEVEIRPTAEMVQGRIDYYKGKINSL